MGQDKQTEEVFGTSRQDKRARQRAAQQKNRDNQPDNSITLKDAATFVAEMTPVIGDAMAAKEVYDELQKDEPNYYLVGALGGATLIGLIPGVGDAAAKAIKKGAKEVFDVAKRIEVDPSVMGSNLGNVRLKPKQPQKTVKAYKLFTKGKDDKLYPLFVDADTEVPTGRWLDATFPDYRFTAENGKQYVPSRGTAGKKGTGDSIKIPDQETRDKLIEAGFLPKGSKAKSVKAVAARPGWHAGDVPIATHIGPETKVGGKKVKYRGDDQVWAEVEMPADVDWQAIANSKARIKKDGTPDVRTADINDEMPSMGHYRYKTNPNMTGEWLIGGEMKVNRVLSRDEVNSINEAAGVKDLPTLEELGKGYSKGGAVMDDYQYAEMMQDQGDPAAKAFSQGGLTDAKDRINALRSKSGSDEQSSLQKFAEWARTNREEEESDESVFERFIQSFMGSPTERGARKKALGQYNEGGIADDGMDVDPVSGNEIPAGSLASEVRDDIPAQLSEGEYVVPADVLRYYGVRFFENLREEAKGDLSEMEANGRIGGEPVLAPDADTGDLTAEELAEIDAVMGMYGGGDVRQAFNEGALATAGGFGGFTAPTSAFNPDMYRPGYTFAENDTTPAMPTAPVVEPKTVTLYGPAGEIATLTLPAEQARYDELLGQGYKTSQAAVTTPATPTTGGDSGDSSNDPEPDTDTDTDGDPTSDTTDFSFDIDDPLAAVNKALDSKNRFGKVAGAIVGTAINPLAGKALSAVGEGFQGYANLKSASENLAVAKALGYDVTKEQAKYDSKLKELGTVENLLETRDRLDAAGRAAVEALFDPAATGGVDRSKFQSDEAFDSAMQEMAPPGTTYDPGLTSTQTNPDTGETTTTQGGYTRAPGTLAPITSIRPVGRPDTGGSSNDSSSNDNRSNVGNYGGDRDGDGVPNAIDFNDGVGWADTNKSDSGGETGGGSTEGSGCCFIMLEARYGDGTMDKVVRRYRDEYMTDTNRRGYYKTAEVLVPLMRKSKVFKWVVTKTFADPLVAYGKYYYGENRYGVIFAPVKTLWMKVFNTVGGDTKFIRENGETV